MFDIAELIRKHKIIAISRRIPADKAVDTAQALWNGGIDENNLNDYLKAGAAGAGIGSNIVKNSLIEQSRFDDLTKLAQIYTSNHRAGSSIATAGTASAAA